MRINSFSEANIFWKSAPFLKQKYIEKQLVCWGRNILKISSFSGADICWKSARFWGQKSIGKSIVFWRINILKIACFLWQNYIENQPILWGKCPIKISPFSIITTPENELIFNAVLFLGKLILIAVKSVFFSTNFVDFLDNKTT